MIYLQILNNRAWAHRPLKCIPLVQVKVCQILCVVFAHSLAWCLAAAAVEHQTESQILLHTRDMS